MAWNSCVQNNFELRWQNGSYNLLLFINKITHVLWAWDVNIQRRRCGSVEILTELTMLVQRWVSSGLGKNLWEDMQWYLSVVLAGDIACPIKLLSGFNPFDCNSFQSHSYSQLGNKSYHSNYAYDRVTVSEWYQANGIISEHTPILVEKCGLLGGRLGGQSWAVKALLA